MKGVLITSSILIVLIAALRPLLRGKINPRVQYALWLAVALRLLIPVNLVDSAYSVLALVDRVGEQSRLVEDIGRTTIPVQSYDSARLQVLEEYQRQGIEESTLTPGDLMDIEQKTVERMQGPTLAELAEKSARPVRLGGAAMMAAWFLLVNLRLRRRLRDAEYVEVDCPLTVYVSDALPSPCLCSVVRPVICVTPAALESPERLRHVLAHELTHYRHRDHWWALLRCLLLCAYWFDPLVWWAAALSRQDCELACDEGAIRALGEGERLPYGRTLVDMIAAGRTPLLQTATTMTGGKRKARERIRLIARKPKTVVAVALALVLVMGCAVGCTFTGALEMSPSSSRPGLDTLQARLEAVPEDLQADVVVRPYEQAVEGDLLVHYWMNRDWTDLDGSGLGWLLGVRRLSQAELDEYRDNGGSEIFARSGETYFAIVYATDVRYYTVEDADPFHNAFNAIRDFAEKTVLETEGVEPYSPGLAKDTLQSRLEDIPEELRVEVALYQGDAPQPEHSVDLAFYLLANPTGPEDWESWLLTVRQLDQLGFEDWLYSVGAGHTNIFARDSEHYYAASWPTSVEYSDADAGRYAAASKAIWDYARQQVLETEGVEPYDPTELREREYLWEGKNYTDVAYWPYKAINGNTDIVWIYRMVQLAKDGEGGVWIPERWQCIDTAVSPIPRHIKPDTGGLTVTQYAQQLQAEADAGRADWATDPIEALRRYEEETSNRTIPLDSFTQDASYIESVLEKLEPSPGQKAVQAVVDRLMAGPTIELSLGPAGTSRVYAYITDPSEDYYINRLTDLASDFQWEEAPYSTASEADSLRISSPDGSASLFLSDGSYLMLVGQDGESTCYKGLYRYQDDPDYLAYDHLRWWFDQVELDKLRSTLLSVPDRGQSREEIARAWAEGYEGVLTHTAPGSQYACTSMEVIDVNADELNWLSEEELESWCRSRNFVFTAQDFGKTWFAFSYRTVFVPVDQSTANGFFVGNTWYYEEDDAPEGALTYSRTGVMFLTDEGWTCTGTGTGW